MATFEMELNAMLLQYSTREIQNLGRDMSKMLSTVILSHLYRVPLSYSYTALERKSVQFHLTFISILQG